MTDYQEEVLTSLLGLQADLRGAEAETPDEQPAEVSAAVPAPAETDGLQDSVAVTHDDVTVSMPSRPSTNGMGVNERLAALNDRLARLEQDLAGVNSRIERVEPDADVQPPAGVDPDGDDRWRSFLDLQKIVANRLDKD